MIHKCHEDIEASESKNNQLNNIKSKLEKTVDDLENSLQKEKKERSDLEKRKRKLEAELRISIETVSEKEKEKNDLSQTLSRKNNELKYFSAKLDDEQGLVIKCRNQIKDLGQRVEDLEIEVQNERHARNNSEKLKTNLSRDLEDLSEKLKDTTGISSSQLDINIRKDSEIKKLKRELEEEIQLHQSQLDTMKKKHNQIVDEVTEDINKQVILNNK